MERETRELETQEPEERSSIFQKVAKALVIGASVVGLGFLLRNRLGSLQSHTIPPIIIKSFDDGTEPIEVESRTTLQEGSTLTNDSDTLTNEADTITTDTNAHVEQFIYTMPGFGVTKYVKVSRKNTATGVSLPPEEYRSNGGLTVNLWLQHKQFGGWQDEPNGPHLVVTGTTADFPLTCERLSADKPTGNSGRPRKRSYNKNKKWRIGKVQVANNTPLSTNGFNEVTITFDNHFH
ncbi:MAG TPA: hypothetical protein VFZ23_09110 [Pyrinomonadaceae bacterium]